MTLTTATTASPVPAAPAAGTQQLLDWLYDFSNRRINYRLMDERRTLPPHVVLEFGNAGLFGLQVPRLYGGLELPDREALRIYEYLGTMNITLAAFLGQNNSLGIRPIVGFAGREIKERFLPALASGRQLASYALTEPAAGSFPNNMEGSLQALDDGSFLLNAHKIFIGNAGWAGVINVFVKHYTATGKVSGFSGCVVPADAKGVHIGAEHLTMGLKAAVQNELTFKDVQVAPGQLLGGPGDSYKVSHHAMQMSRLVIGAISLGGLKRCLHLMNTYASRRNIATGRLIDNPITLCLLNETVARIQAIAALTGLAADRLDAGEAVPDEVFMAVKALGSEFLWEAADSLVQLLGGRGYMENNPAASLFRDARVLRVFEGPTETLFYFTGFLARQKKLLRFLEGDLGQEALAQELETFHGELAVHAEKIPSFDVSQKGHFVHSRLGAVMAWVLLLAAVQKTGGTNPGATTVMTLQWLRQKIDGLKTQYTGNRFTASLLDKQHIAAVLGSYPGLGLEQLLPDEIKGTDSYLTREGGLPAEALFQ